MKGTGIWYNLETKETVDVSLSSHIKAVMRDPFRFGVTNWFIDQEYARTGERFGLEGSARSVILRQVLATSPWVRVRETKHESNQWTFEAWVPQPGLESEGDARSILVSLFPERPWMSEAKVEVRFLERINDAPPHDRLR